MDYGGLIPIVAYLAAFQLTIRFDISPFFSTAIAVLIPYLLSLTVNYIIDSNNGVLSLPGVFSLSSLSTVVIQCFVGFYIFKKIQSQDDLTATVAWGGFGFFLIIGIPILIELIR